MLPPYFLNWFRIDNKHMTEPWLDQALMDSAYRSGKSTRHFQFPNIKENVFNTLQSTDWVWCYTAEETDITTYQRTEYDVMQQKKPTFPHIKEMCKCFFKWPSIERLLCLIHTGTIEIFIWSTIWQIDIVVFQGLTVLNSNNSYMCSCSKKSRRSLL